MSSTTKNAIFIGGSLIAISLFFSVPFLVYKGTRENKEFITPNIINNQENYDMELLSTTPEGTKIYRIRGEKMIVPLILVQSQNGQVAIR